MFYTSTLLILFLGQRQLHENCGIFCLAIHSSYGALLIRSHIMLYVCSGTRKIVYVINHRTALLLLWSAGYMSELNLFFGGCFEHIVIHGMVFTLSQNVVTPKSSKHHKNQFQSSYTYI